MCFFLIDIIINRSVVPRSTSELEVVYTACTCTTVYDKLSSVVKDVFLSLFSILYVCVRFNQKVTYSLVIISSQTRLQTDKNMNENQSPPFISEDESSSILRDRLLRRQMMSKWLQDCTSSCSSSFTSSTTTTTLEDCTKLADEKKRSSSPPPLSTARESSSGTTNSATVKLNCLESCREIDNYADDKERTDITRHVPHQDHLPFTRTPVASCESLFCSHCLHLK